MNTHDVEALAAWADHRNTSIEIAEAIFTVADGDLDAHRVWNEATEAEFDDVVRRAFGANPQAMQLVWSDMVVDRPFAE